MSVLDFKLRVAVRNLDMKTRMKYIRRLRAFVDRAEIIKARTEEKHKWAAISPLLNYFQSKLNVVLEAHLTISCTMVMGTTKGTMIIIRE